MLTFAWISAFFSQGSASGADHFVALTGLHDFNESIALPAFSHHITASCSCQNGSTSVVFFSTDHLCLQEYLSDCPANGFRTGAKLKRLAAARGLHKKFADRRRSV